MYCQRKNINLAIFGILCQLCKTTSAASEQMTGRGHESGLFERGRSVEHVTFGRRVRMTLGYPNLRSLTKLNLHNYSISKLNLHNCSMSAALTN